MNRALATAPLAAALVALGPNAFAQAPRPWIGVGLAVQTDSIVPPGAPSQGSPHTGPSDPVSAGYLIRVHARIAPRVLVHLDASAFHWFASERYSFQRVAVQTAVSTQAVFVPLDLGVRINVLPVLGPHQLLVGAGARAMFASWEEDLGDRSAGPALVVGRGGSWTAGVFAELAYEVLFERRIGLEVSARYAIGLVPQALGTSIGRFADPTNISTLALALGANYYF